LLDIPSSRKSFMLVASLALAAQLQAAHTASIRSDSASDSVAVAALRRTLLPDARVMPDWALPPAQDTQPRKRRRAVQYSDQYYTRLQIHRVGSWLELPVFGAEYWLGQKLINDASPASWVKPTHTTVALALGGLFTVNTVTGLANLWESRASTDDRALVWTHSALMLAADAGFIVTGAISGDANHSVSGRDRHRNAALTSIGIATVGTLLMWVKRGL
jgi:hypothetical protein